MTSLMCDVILRTFIGLVRNIYPTKNKYHYLYIMFFTIHWVNKKIHRNAKILLNHYQKNLWHRIHFSQSQKAYFLLSITPLQVFNLVYSGTILLSWQINVLWMCMGGILNTSDLTLCYLQLTRLFESPIFSEKYHKPVNETRQNGHVCP